MAFNIAYYVQTDGQLEVINMTLETYLRFFIGERLKKWVQWIPIAKWWYNMTTHAYTQLAPFEALYGHPPPKLLSYIESTSTVEVVDATLKSRDKISQLLKHNLLKSQDRMKKYANLKRK